MKTAKNALFIIIILIGTILLGEILFRVYYSIRMKSSQFLVYGLQNVFQLNLLEYKGYHKCKGLIGVSPKDPVQKPFMGLRTRPFAIPKPKDEYRIVTMGGSACYDPLAIDADHTWSGLLEQKLNTTSTHWKYRLINAGVPLQNTYGVDRLLTDEVFNWQPNMVIFYTLINHAFIDSFFLKDYDSLFRVLKLLGYKKSLIITALVEKLTLNEKFAFKNKFESYRYLLTDMVTKCQTRGVTPVLVKQLINPRLFLNVSLTRNRRIPGYNPDQYAEFLKIVDEVGREKKCPVVDFSAYSDICRNNIDRFVKDSVHLKADGIEALAQTLYQNLKDIAKQ